MSEKSLEILYVGVSPEETKQCWYVTKLDYGHGSAHKPEQWIVLSTSNLCDITALLAFFGDKHQIFMTLRLSMSRLNQRPVADLFFTMHQTITISLP